jgi:predicted nucleic acid-binding protein
VLVDTSAFYALADPRDGFHVAATRIQGILVSERWSLFTTNYLVAETHALILNRVGRTTAATVLQAIDQTSATGELVVVRVGLADERRARDILLRYDDKDFSLADATAFAVMERLRISFAFTFDRHYEQYGFASRFASG